MSTVTRVVLFSLVLRVFCVPHSISIHHDNILPTRTSQAEGLRGRDSGLDLSPTPAPTGPNSINTTVWIRDATNFAILLPPSPGGSVSGSEGSAISFCMGGTQSCTHPFPSGLITAAAYATGDDYVQITGCINRSAYSLSSEDQGGQMDVRFPDGAQCTHGGYGASFIEQVEPADGRFCMRCCSSANDQTNCNSHRDRDGCPTVVPGVYDFPDIGVSCA